MNPTAQLEPSEPQSPPDATPSSAPEDLRDFPYGRRYIRRVTDDGEVVHDIVPLALEDLLHPEEEDELVSRRDHSRDCRYLVLGLERFKPKNKRFVVGDDINVDLGLPGVKPIRPDVCVCEVASIPDGFESVGTLDLPQLGGVPLLFIEVTSSSTRPNDVGPKFSLYERAKVQQYILVDRVHPSGTVQLSGYEYEGQSLVKQQADSSGRLRLSAFELELWIGLEDGQAVLHDKHGIVPAPEEWAEQAEKWAEQAEVETARAAAAESRMRELEAELARLKRQ